MSKTYDRIENVIRESGRALAPHEFAQVVMGYVQDINAKWQNARAYVGCSESTLGRRMREMVVIGRLFSQKREGKSFKEFGLVRKDVPLESQVA